MLSKIKNIQELNTTLKNKNKEYNDQLKIKEEKRKQVHEKELKLKSKLIELNKYKKQNEEQQNHYNDLLSVKIGKYTIQDVNNLKELAKQCKT